MHVSLPLYLNFDITSEHRRWNSVHLPDVATLNIFSIFHYEYGSFNSLVEDEWPDLS